MLKIKEIFYSLQGEGRYSGRPAIFVRFSGCNLWSGKQIDRNKTPCYFCDTDFVGGVKYSEDALCMEILSRWPIGGGMPFIIFTGGEPTLQLTDSLMHKIRVELSKTKSACNFAVETNGTTSTEYAKPLWITVSPKTKDFVRRSGSELKLLWPLAELHPDSIKNVDFKYYYLQPIMDPNYKDNLATAVEYCLKHPQWNLSVQQHKIVGIE